MSWQFDLIHRSQNGDAWHLLREAPSGCVLVKHVANLSSGGQVTDLSMEEFLAVDGPGPEHRALRGLLARLAGCVRPEPVV